MARPKKQDIKFTSKMDDYVNQKKEKVIQPSGQKARHAIETLRTVIMEDTVFWTEDQGHNIAESTLRKLGQLEAFIKE
jgi:hypothetical protein